MVQTNFLTKSNGVSTDLQRDVTSGIPEMPKRLPNGMKEILEPYQQSHHDALAICALPALAQLAQNARFELEPDEDPNSKGDRVTFLAALTAQQASGKSAMKKMCDRLLLHQYQQDEEVRDTYREWDETHDLTGDPMPQLSFNSLPPDSTNAAFFQNVKRLKGKSMFVVAPEIDSFRERCSWANSGSIWRLAYDHDRAGQGRFSKNSVSCYEKLYLNVCMSGTPGALLKFFNNTEDGTVSRILFASFNDDLGQPYQPDQRRSPENQAAIEEIISRLSSEKVPEHPYCLPELEQAMNDWAERQRMNFIVSDNGALDTFRRRCRMLGMRAGAIAWLMEGHQMSDVVIDFAIWVASYALYQQMKLFGRQMNDSVKQNVRIMQSKGFYAKDAVFVQLDGVFSQKDIRKMYEAQDLKATGYRALKFRWLNEGLIEAVPSIGKEDSYRKTQKGIELTAQLLASVGDANSHTEPAA